MKEISENMAIHCTSKEEANSLLLYLKDNGYRWPHREIYEYDGISDFDFEDDPYYFIEKNKVVLLGNSDDIDEDIDRVVEYQYLTKGDIRNVEIRLETYSPRIRKMAIKCPYCYSWFRYIDVLDERTTRKMSENQIYGAECTCPKCDKFFIIDDPEIDKPEDGSDIYKDCLKRKKIEIWE